MLLHPLTYIIVYWILVVILLIARYQSIYEERYIGDMTESKQTNGD
jgi:hypothetical protein